MIFVLDVGSEVLRTTEAADSVRTVKLDIPPSFDMKLVGEVFVGQVDDPLEELYATANR